MITNIPSCSPLQLRSHQFTLVNIFANPNGNPSSPTTVNQYVGFSPVPGQPHHWNLQLQIKMGSSNSSVPFFYEIEIHILGVVELSGAVPEESCEQIAVINGLTLLYGACREMIINVTSRCVYGPISIPSLNFAKVLQEAQEHQLARQTGQLTGEKTGSASVVH